MKYFNLRTNIRIYSYKISTILLLTVSNCIFLTAQPLHFVSSEHLPSPMVINPQLYWTKSVDMPKYLGMGFQISFDHIEKSTLTYIWSLYENKGECLYATKYENGRRSSSHLFSVGKDVIYQPVFIPTSENSVWEWTDVTDGSNSIIEP